MQARHARRAILVFALSAAMIPASSRADVSINVGWVSDYLFRGIFQHRSSLSAGVEYRNDAGFYASTWNADVGDGLETDLSFGYGRETGVVDWHVGYTGYYYTENFDDTYREINFGVSRGILGAEVAMGRWDGFGHPADYVFTSVTVSPRLGPYYKIGSFGSDFDGEYAEVGYSFNVRGVDLSLAATFSNDLPVTADNDDRNYTLVFGISKKITFGRNSAE